MSHNSTPRLNSKRTPGAMASETPGHASLHSESSPASSQHPSLRNYAGCGLKVSDQNVTNARQLLNAYVYEYLLKSTLPETAKQFVAEADVPSISAGQASARTSPLLMNRPENSVFNKDNGSAMSSGGTPSEVVQLAEEHNLPGLALSMEAPQGFLYEWWQVYWDVHQAKNNRNRSSAMAGQYYQMQMMRQRQTQEAFGLDVHAQNPNFTPHASVLGPGQTPVGMVNAPHGVQMNGPGMVNPGPQGPIQPNQQQQQQLQRQMQGQQPPPHMDPRQQRYMMQMMMKQQQFQQQQQQQQLHQQRQQQQQQQPHPQQGPQGLQPPANPQNIQLQQQQQTPHQTPLQTPLQTPPVNQIPRQHPHGMDQSLNNSAMKQPMYVPQPGMSQAQNRIQQQAQTQMNNLRQQAVVAQQQQGPGQGSAAAAVAAVAAAAAAASADPHSRDAPTPANVNGQRINQVRSRQMPLNMEGMPYQGNMPNGAAMSPPYVTGNVMGNGMPMASNAQSGRNSNALQDYQMQLMVLERQNKKRLDIARSNGTTESPVAMQQVQQPMHMNQGPPAQSPHMSNHASPGGVAKPKRESVKKGKQPASNNAMTPKSAGTETGALNGRASTQTKREREAPLTPAADTEGTKKKKKLSGGDSPKKPAKSTGAKREKATPKIKAADEPGAEIENGDVGDSMNGKMPPPSGPFFQPTLGSVEIIAGSEAGASGNGEVNFFNPGGNSSIDDIDFDFNSFLDGGDEGLNDGLSGFNWGNPIEGD
ncbi:hypothetical protein OXX80_013054 [Metschnikowia pulcherrima]